MYRKAFVSQSLQVIFIFFPVFQYQLLLWQQAWFNLHRFQNVIFLLYPVPSHDSFAFHSSVIHIQPKSENIPQVSYFKVERAHSHNFYYSIVLYLSYFIINYSQYVTVPIQKLNFILALYMQEKHNVSTDFITIVVSGPLLVLDKTASLMDKKDHYIYTHLFSDEIFVDKNISVLMKQKLF